MGELLGSSITLVYALRIAHGQMTGRQIEEIMTDFYEGHYDVLLSTVSLKPA